MSDRRSFPALVTLAATGAALVTPPNVGAQDSPQVTTSDLCGLDQARGYVPSDYARLVMAEINDIKDAYHGNRYWGASRLLEARGEVQNAIQRACGGLRRTPVALAKHLVVEAAATEESTPIQDLVGTAMLDAEYHTFG